MREFCDRAIALVMASSDSRKWSAWPISWSRMYRGRAGRAIRRGEVDMQRVLADITHPARQHDARSPSPPCCADACRATARLAGGPPRCRSGYRHLCADDAGLPPPLSFALLTAISFIGCVAVGMTFITITGNIMSLCARRDRVGVGAVFLALPVGSASCRHLRGASSSASRSPRLQGVVIGYFRANPILVSIAALALISASPRSSPAGSAFIRPAAGFGIFKARVAGHSRSRRWCFFVDRG